jgi:hypothetical protein
VTRAGVGRPPWAAVLLVLACVALVGCASQTLPPSPTASPTPDSDLVEHDIPASGVALALPPDWLALDATDLADPDVRAGLERDFAGARGLLAAIDAQGSRVKVEFVGVDGSARGRQSLAPAVAVVAVEPRIPPIGLALGAGLVLSGLEHALALETPIERGRIDVPVGDAIGFSFEHRIADTEGGPGVRAALDGALVTTEQKSFVIVRNVDAAGASDAPSLKQVLATLRVVD